MDCKQYQGWLSDEALDGLSPAGSAELRSHLAGCSACRAELERRRAFLNAMDQSVAASSAGEPSPAFAALVRERIAEQPSATPWLFSWLPWTAGAALAVAALMTFMLWPREHAQTPGAHSPQLAKTTEYPGPAVKPAGPSAPSGKPVRRGRSVRPVASVRAAVRQAPVVEVIVPREEMDGIAWLARQLRQRPAQTTSWAADLRARGELQALPLQLEERRIAPLEIAPVEIFTGSEDNPLAEGKEQE